jgi:hypothetical protein
MTAASSGLELRILLEEDTMDATQTSNTQTSNTGNISPEIQVMIQTILRILVNFIKSAGPKRNQALK